MTAFIRALTNAAISVLLPGARYTATGNGTGVDMQDYEGTVAVVSSFSAGGSGATLDLTIEESDDNSTGWVAIAAGQYGTAFTQHANTAASQIRTLDVQGRKRYWRGVRTVAGTAAFDGGVEIIGIKKYSP